MGVPISSGMGAKLRAMGHRPAALPVNIGNDLADAREETFCRMVADGVTLGASWARAGFPAEPDALRAASAGAHLFRQDRIRARVEAILAARAEASHATLPEVSDMLRRIYAEALHNGEYGAAHSAAFSLARLHGLIIDRAQIDVVRRPAREPDAPAEQALGAWVQALPPMITIEGPKAQDASNINSLAGPGPLGPEVYASPDGVMIPSQAGPGPSGPENLNEIKELPRPGRPENGAPSMAVTGTPSVSAQSAPEAKARHPKAGGGPRAPKKRVPLQSKKVGPKPLKRPKKIKLVPRVIPTAKELFG